MSRRSAILLLASARFSSLAEAAWDLEKPVSALGGELGFSMLHVESGEKFAVRGGDRFPMASVYKLPIAITVLDAVDRGALRLEQTVRLLPRDLRLGLGTDEVERLVGKVGYDFSLRELLRRTLVDSDNASSDALLRLVSARAVTHRMVALGVPEIRVDRTELQLLLDFVGASSVEPAGGWTVDRIRERYRSATLAQRHAALQAFHTDPRDTTTPDAMVSLLLQVHRGTALKSHSGELLRSFLAQCKTGANRLRGKLPASISFLHRTGTTDTTDGVTAGTNDVGILHLPRGKGTIILAAFLRRCSGSMAQREEALASIGQQVAHHFDAP
ncbi:MAG: class A beta-lactamase-related serine hydrolase [Bryobacterales bacterium]|nr:class A beta-lactamase-related serine hydrolase [Bryobacterales bacterium]